MGLLPALAVVASLLQAQQRPCHGPDSLGPSRDLYCIELIAAPGAEGARGTVELGHVPGPFTVAVTAAGLPRHRLTLDACCPLSGQPDLKCAVRLERVAAGSAT